MNSTRDEVLRFIFTMIILAVEYWVMQPYHSPVLASIWHYIMRVCHQAAYLLGRAAITAERNYYIAVEAGI